MRATVGPLPPAVYWRRRAVVLGALLLAVIVFFVSCSGSGDDNKKRGATGTGATQAPTPAPGGSKPEDQPSFADGGGGDPSLPAPDDLESKAPNPAANPSVPNPTGANANVTAPTSGDCSDQELTLTPLPATNSVKRGATLVIQLKIKNISARTCTRDLGAGAQELYIDQGARKFWSSDTCSNDRSAEVATMKPGSEYEFTITWNGNGSTKCEAALPAGPALPPGHYEVRGRLNAKVSEPAALDIVA